jgi:uncharacterized protein (UPF0332 family)
MFNIRQKVDYRELIEITSEEAAEHVRLANEFIEYIKNYMDKIPTQ